MGSKGSSSSSSPRYRECRARRPRVRGGHLKALSPAPFAELAGVVPTVAERRADNGASALLEALAVLAREPLAGEARAALERLRARGVESPLAGRMGRLQLSEARIIEDESADRLLVVFGRPREREAQLAVLVVERKKTAGALVEGLMTPPASRREVRSVLREALRGVEDRQLARDELAERLESATARAAELELSSRTTSACPSAPRVRARPGGDAFPRLLFEPPPAPSMSIPRTRRASRISWRSYSRTLTRTCAPPTARRGRCSRGATTSRARCSTGNTATATGASAAGRARDVEEYLLDHFPRKLTADPDLIACTPECVAAFLAFLDQRELLTGDPLAELRGGGQRPAAGLRAGCPRPQAVGSGQDDRGPDDGRRRRPRRRARGGQLDGRRQRAAAGRARPAALERSRQVPGTRGAATVERTGAASAGRRAPRASATGADRAGRAKADYSGGSGPSSARSTIPKLISPPSISASSDLSSKATDAISSRKTCAPFSSAPRRRPPSGPG